MAEARRRIHPDGWNPADDVDFAEMEMGFLEEDGEEGSPENCSSSESEDEESVRERKAFWELQQQLLKVSSRSKSCINCAAVSYI